VGRERAAAGGVSMDHVATVSCTKLRHTQIKTLFVGFHSVLTVCASLSTSRYANEAETAIAAAAPSIWIHHLCDKLDRNSALGLVILVTCTDSARLFASDNVCAKQSCRRIQIGVSQQQKSNVTKYLKTSFPSTRLRSRTQK
jgi:hypothetical protein